MFALPNIALEEAIEADGVAVVSFQDERLRQIANDHKTFAFYLDHFRTEFGRRVQPSVIIWRDDSSQHYRSVEALAGFRDAISISVTPYGWATLLRHGHSPDILYSDWFAIYPWMLDKNYEFVVMRTMAQIGLDEAKELRPQSTPGITPRALIRRNIDRPILEALLERWPVRYQTDSPSWETTALFRSLNMANAASKLPASAEGTNYDIGRSIGLWVSAFEILVHTGTRSDLSKVYDIFDQVEWHLTECKAEIYQPHRFKAGQRLRTLACWVYGQIYEGRNDFMHGNPVTADTLIVPQSDRHLLHYAPILYRMALAGFLKLKWDKPEPTLKEELDTYESRKFDFGYFQSDMEAALATILYSKEEYAALREGRAMRLRPALKSA